MKLKRRTIFYYFFTFILLSFCVIIKAVDINSGDTVTLRASTTDIDCYHGGQNPPDSSPDDVTVTWSAVFDGTSNPAGTFPGGNTGTSVQWTAPEVCSDTDIVITATADDTGTSKADLAMAMSGLG